MGWNIPERYKTVLDEFIGQKFLYIIINAIKEANQYAQKRLIDDTGTYTYIGLAEAGAATSANSWLIVRIDSNGNQLLADGNTNYDNIWDNRASLTYA